jgi:hypothetical protein
LKKYQWPRKILIFFLLFLFISAGVFFAFSRARMQTESITATVKISICGNNEAEGGEDCDGPDLAGNSCITLGFGGGGELSCDLSCAFNTSECIPGPVETSVVTFSGTAYPSKTVTLLKDGLLAATAPAAADGSFTISASSLAAGSYGFSLYCTDKNDNKSKTLAYRVDVGENEAKSRSGIIFPPTVEASKSELKQGDFLTIFGQAAPNATVRILVSSDAADDFYLTAASGSDGGYSYRLDTSSLEKGRYQARAKVVLGSGDSSGYGERVNFSVEETAVETVSAKADLNGDGKINLIDFSILIYWFDRQNPPSEVDLHEDGEINLKDFSILMYYWTG